ncbi:hypothetical protein ACF0H5_021908 [Mactra antiquata]
MAGEEDQNAESQVPLKPPEKNEKNNTCTNDFEDFSDLDTGWAWVILASSFGTFCLIGSMMYAVGIIHSSLLGRYGESVSVTAWAGAIHTSSMSIGAPLSSAVIDRYSCRTAIVLSGLFFILGYMCTAFAPTIWWAIFTCGVVAGIGAALGYTANLLIVSFYFRKRRDLALGISNAGVGAGLFIIAPLMQLARDYYGPTGFFIILSGMAANIVTFGMVCFPSKLELHTQKERQFECKIRNEQLGKETIFSSFRPYVKVLLNKAVMLLCVTMFTYGFGTYLIYLHLPNFIVSKDFSAIQAAFIVSLSGIVSVIGRVLTGIVASFNKIDVVLLYSGSMFIVAASSMIYPFVTSHFYGHVIYAVMLGMFFGSCYVLITSVTLEFLDLNYVSAAIGLQFFFAGIGAIAGPVLAGVLIDALGTYEESYIFAAACTLLASLSSGLTSCCKRRGSPYKEVNFEMVVPEKAV